MRLLRRLLISGLLMTNGGQNFADQGTHPMTQTADPTIDRLRQHVEWLSSTLPRRDAEDVPHLSRAADYIRRELESAGGRMSEQVFFTEEFNQHNKKIRKGPYKNIIAEFGPQTAERIVVGAHYDAYGPFPGADDNASGVAILLELSRRFAAEPPPLRTELAAYSLEEPPSFGTKEMGSYFHAKSLNDSGAKVRVMICLECLGYFDEKRGSQSYPVLGMKLLYPSRGNFVAVVGRLGDARLIRHVKRSFKRGSAVPAQGLGAPAWLPGVDFSDHRNYWTFGIPAVMLTDTAFYRNRRYHTVQDKPDTLDYGRMAQIIPGVERIVKELAP